ncbi:hypothetical protein PGB28_17600 [Primorskyibacter aestuariivivens]|uniref:hypothetical protein n=1 Tax=Primorskyibacter aestuariivivens TaxID=1888912 RepID=UPI002301E3AD|nr:hypothetical protein [Primorskyibacter aestuariivivens]MDA7430282.1 hypothetical protein [Primorskyibacter aestuariivivens]
MNELGNAAKRQDILVSVCCAGLAPTDETFKGMKKLAARVGERFQFWEIVLIVEDQVSKSYLHFLHDIPYLRLFTVRPNVGLYRQRVIAASEAIGDVVLIVGAREINELDPVEMLEKASDGSTAIIGLRASEGRIERALSLPLIALGRGAGFKVSLRDMQTIAIPRTLLSHILAYPDQELALRFPPLDGRVPLDYKVARGTPGARDRASFGLRASLLHKLLVNLAPRLLTYVSLAAAMSVVLGLFYTAYAIGAWLVLPVLEPGWLTISLALSLTTTSLGFAIFGLSLGVQHLLARIERTEFDDVTSELNSVDLFGRVARDLNVEVIDKPQRQAVE